jgi:hypothetical protein
MEAAVVTGVFRSEDEFWGNPGAEDSKGRFWTHLCGTPDRIFLHKDKLSTPEQKMAYYKEEMNTLLIAMNEITIEQAQLAVQILESEICAGSEKALGPARWFRDLMLRVKDMVGQERQSVLWQYVALAPAGFCHPRGTMVGTIYEDLKNGKAVHEIRAAWNAKMHPLKYQRAQVAPTAGNIARAETVIEKLGIAKSLERRYATKEDCTFLWLSKDGQTFPTGVFGHLKPKSERTMTWERFADSILPGAGRIMCEVTRGPMPF